MLAEAVGWSVGILALPLDWTRNRVKVVYLRSGGNTSVEARKIQQVTGVLFSKLPQRAIRA